MFNRRCCNRKWIVFFRLAVSLWFAMQCILHFCFDWTPESNWESKHAKAICRIISQWLLLNLWQKPEKKIIEFTLINNFLSMRIQQIASQDFYYASSHAQFSLRDPLRLFVTSKPCWSGCLAWYGTQQTQQQQPTSRRISVSNKTIVPVITCV